MKPPVLGSGTGEHAVKPEEKTAVTAIPDVMLNNGRAIPQFGFGVFLVRLGKSPAQVVLRRHIERGDIVFPKSVTPARIRENIDIFDFELTGEDVEVISALNRDERTSPDRDTFDVTS